MFPLSLVSPACEGLHKLNVLKRGRNKPISVQHLLEQKKNEQEIFFGEKTNYFIFVVVFHLSTDSITNARQASKHQCIILLPIARLERVGLTCVRASIA
jgi:hypothetical protein